MYYTRTYTYIHIYIYICIYVYMYVYTYIYTCVHVHICIHMYIYICMHACRHAYIRTHIHTCTHVDIQKCTDVHIDEVHARLLHNLRHEERPHRLRAEQAVAAPGSGFGSRPSPSKRFPWIQLVVVQYIDPSYICRYGLILVGFG